MGDKSPHDSHTKKTGKSIKEKRADKRAKAERLTPSAPSQVQLLTQGKKRGS